MLGRNVDDHFAKTPTPHFPRSRFDMGIHKRLQSQGHGRLYPFFARLVYPGDTWQMDCSVFGRMDTSARVPLDDVYNDIYWFFVPLRIIDQNFPKILGEGEPEDYDDVSYGFPTCTVGNDDDYNVMTINNVLQYLGYSQAGGYGGNLHDLKTDVITAYPLMAYYKVYNDWFRDENLDGSVPYSDIIGSVVNDSSGLLHNPLFDDLDCLKINKFHDYFTSGMIAPQKGPAVTIPLGTSAPVGFVPSNSLTSTGSSLVYGVTSSGETLVSGQFQQSVVYGESGGVNSNVIADLSQAAGTINELKLALSLQALYERRATFGTRYIEVIRGQWGIEVPDSFFLRPEYLGGNRVTLNNVPVLSTENSSQLGQMAGNSSTLFNGGSWSKTFIEYGIILGVSCTRIKHSYMQGKRKELFGLKTQVDLYNPVFANIGPQPIKLSEIYNDPSFTEDGVTYKADDVVFNYQEPWADLKSDVDTFAGLFGLFSTNTEIKNK